MIDTPIYCPELSHREFTLGVLAKIVKKLQKQHGVNSRVIFDCTGEHNNVEIVVSKEREVE